MMQQRPKREWRYLDELKPFPSQATMFDALSDNELNGLAKDIHERGLKHLVEVLPKNKAGFLPNTILSGHQRVAACTLNGDMEVEVRVRYDLADTERDTIELEFLTDNFLRRQLDPLAKARVALRLVEIEKKVKAGVELSATQQGEVRDRVGKIMGMSGRNVDRYLSVLKTPQEVQEAFRKGKLPLDMAARVAGFDKALQNRIASGIRQGKDPRATFAKCVASCSVAAVSPNADSDRLIRTLVAAADRLGSNAEVIAPVDLTSHLDDLKRARQHLRRLIGLAEKSQLGDN